MSEKKVVHPALVSIRSHSSSVCHLICFHHAGGAASFFRPWGNKLPSWINAYAFQLPGRENRMVDELKYTMEEVVDEAVEAISLLDDKPVVLFGHSMGALMAYEVAIRMNAGRNDGVVALFMSGCKPPHRRECSRPIHELPDEEFISEVVDIGGTPEEVFKDKELMEFLLPRLRADFQISEQYRLSRIVPIPSNLRIMIGRSDKTTAGTQLEDWYKYSNRNIEIKRFSGGHFYLSDYFGEVLEYLNSSLYEDVYIKPGNWGAYA